MGVIVSLVFDKVSGVIHLPYVVVISPNPGKNGIGPNVLAGRLGQIGYHNGMAVGAGGYGKESP